MQPAYARDLWDTGPALATNLQDVQLTCKQAADGMRRDSSNAQLLGGLSGKAALFPSLLMSRKEMPMLSGIVRASSAVRSSRSFVPCLTSQAMKHSTLDLSYACFEPCQGTELYRRMETHLAGMQQRRVDRMCRVHNEYVYMLTAKLIGQRQDHRHFPC